MQLCPRQQGSPSCSCAVRLKEFLTARSSFTLCSVTEKVRYKKLRDSNITRNSMCYPHAFLILAVKLCVLLAKTQIKVAKKSLSRDVSGVKLHQCPSEEGEATADDLEAALYWRVISRACASTRWFVHEITDDAVTFVSSSDLASHQRGDSAKSQPKCLLFSSKASYRATPSPVIPPSR